jgi:hypothetical protein
VLELPDGVDGATGATVLSPQTGLGDPTKCTASLCVGVTETNDSANDLHRWTETTLPLGDAGAPTSAQLDQINDSWAPFQMPFAMGTNGSDFLFVRSGPGRAGSPTQRSHRHRTEG